MREVTPTRRKAAFVFILITVALDMLALGVMIPVLPKLITQFEGGAESPVNFTRCVPTAEINLGAYLSAVKGDRVDLPLSGSDAAYDRWPLDELAARAQAK